MIFSLALLPSPTCILKIFRRYEEEKKQSPTKPDCRGANFRDVRNVDDKTCSSQPSRESGSRRDTSEFLAVNAECKRLKMMRKLKESFASEVGVSSWKEAASKYPSFASFMHTHADKLK